MLLWRPRASTGAEPTPTPVTTASTVLFWTGTLAKAVSPLTILVGRANGAATDDVTDKVPIDSINIEETGTRDEATASFAIIDKALLYSAMRGEWKVSISHGDRSIFRGYIGRPSSEIKAIYGERAASARDVGSLIDRLIVKSRFVRPEGESDKARLQWLIDTIGQPLVEEGMTQWGKVQVLNANMPKQTFPTRLTLRQCIERVLGAASDSANYYIDMEPRLHTFDADHPEAGWTAPFHVNTTSSPASYEIAPEDLRVDWDSDGIVNSYYVRGKNAAGSGWYTDKDLLQPPWSIYLFGLRSAYIDAPDADTQFKAERIARQALMDTRNPIPRGSFSVHIGPNDEPFEAGQLLLVKSPVHGLNANDEDAGPWAGLVKPQPLRIVNVSTSYISGAGHRVQQIEFGGRQTHRYTASIG